MACTSIHILSGPFDWLSPGNKTCRIPCYSRDASELPQVLLAFNRSLCDSWTMRYVRLCLDAIPNPSCIFWMWQWTLWRDRKCAFITRWVCFSYHDSVYILTCNNSSVIDPPYPVYSGLFHKEAIMLLRRFYIQENEKGICLLYQTCEFFLLMPKSTQASTEKEQRIEHKIRKWTGGLWFRG